MLPIHLTSKCLFGRAASTIRHSMDMFLSHKIELLSFWTNLLDSSYYYFSSSGYDRFESELNMKSLPDMIFANNSIKLKHENGFEIEFNAKDALNLCDKEKCPDILVQAADSWARV